MAHRFLAHWVVATALISPGIAGAAVIDDFEDGAFAITASGVGGEVVQSGLDPTHVVGGARTVELTNGINSDPIAAFLTLSAGDDALVFRSGDNGLHFDAVQISWDLPAGTLLTNPLNSSAPLVVEIEITPPFGTLEPGVVNLFFESSGGLTLHGNSRLPSLPSGTIVIFVASAVPVDQLTRMSLVFSEFEPFTHDYAFHEVRVSVFAPKPDEALLFAAAAVLLSATRRKPRAS